MTDPGRRVVLGAVDADVAACLLDLADELGADRVARDDVHAALVAERPDTKARRAPSAAQASRRRFDGRRTSGGWRSRDVLLKSLTKMERLGIARRDDDDVVLLDRAALEQLAAR